MREVLGNGGQSTIAIAAGILGSEFHQSMTSGELSVGTDTSSFPTVHPNLIADQLWSRSQQRDVFEVVYPPLG